MHPAGAFAGTVDVKLCRDADCAVAQTVPRVAVPYALRVMAATTAWPGNNLTTRSPWAGVADWTTVQGNAAVNPDQFMLRWKTGGNPLSQSWSTSKPNLVASNGLFYVVTSEHLDGGVLFAKREHDGSEAWRTTTRRPSAPTAGSTPTPAPMAACTRSIRRALSSTFPRRPRPPTGRPRSARAAAYSNSLLNGGAIGNRPTNFRTTSASIAWQILGVYPTTPGYKDGVVYVVNQNPLRLEARAEADGALLWSWTPEFVGESKFVSEVLLTDNLAFVSTDYATHAIDLLTRRSVWSYPAAGKLALSARGVLYIHNSTDLIAVNLK